MVVHNFRDSVVVRYFRDSVVVHNFRDSVVVLYFRDSVVVHNFRDSVVVHYFLVFTVIVDCTVYCKLYSPEAFLYIKA